MIDIATLRAAGLSESQIVKVIEEDQKLEREKIAAKREGERIRKRAYRKAIKDQQSRPECPEDAADAVGHSGQSSSPPPPSSSPPIPSLITTPTTPSPEKTSRARGSRLPNDWIPSLDDQAFAMDTGLSRERLQAEGEKFRDYWHARAGPNGVKLDWSATWRNWCRKAIENGGGPNRPNGGGGRGQSLSNLALDLAEQVRERERAAGIERPPDAFGSVGRRQ